MTHDTRIYSVTGMHCDHCVASVREEVSEVPGVGSVDVDLEAGRLEVEGEGFTDEQVHAAVETAGYQVVAP